MLTQHLCVDQGVFVIRKAPGGRRGGRGMLDRSGEDDDLSELEQRLNSARLPEHALKVAQKELKVHINHPTPFLLHSDPPHYRICPASSRSAVPVSRARSVSQLPGDAGGVAVVCVHNRPH